jgi:hypothetical protein
MLLEILLVCGGYCIARHLRDKKSSAHKSTSGLPHSEVLGKQGEAIAHAKLTQTVDWLCGSDYCLLEGPLIIEHAPGSAFPTAELDHLAVTPFGIFIFETKHWSGYAPPFLTDGFLTRIGCNQRTDGRRSPIEQNRTKIQFFRARLPPVWPVTGAGLFTSPEVRLDSSLHIDLLSLGDLPQWLRFKREAFGHLPAIGVEKASAAVCALVRKNVVDVARHKSLVTQRAWSHANCINQLFKKLFLNISVM